MKVRILISIILLVALLAVLAFDKYLSDPIQDLEITLQRQSAALDEVKAEFAKIYPANYLRALRILGKENFITPEEVIQARRVVYHPFRTSHFIKTVPSEETLHWLKANGYALVPGPPTPLGLKDIHALNPGLLFWKNWYPGYGFFTGDTIGPEWLAIRIAPVPHSHEKSWEEQLALLSERERVPNAGEVGWLITTIFLVRDIRLFEETYVRTSSDLQDGTPDHVGVGFFGEEGFIVDSWKDHYRLRDLGLASAMMLSKIK